MKAFYFLLLAVPITLFSSCQSKAGSESQSAQEAPKMDSIYASLDLARIDSAFTTNNISDTSQVFIISRSCSIYTIPDSIHLEKEKQIDSDAFYSMSDDFMFYLGQADDTLQKMGIPQESYQHEKRYIQFKNKGGIICTFDGDKMPEAWGSILFNGKDKPVLWNGTDIKGAAKFIFNR